MSRSPLPDVFYKYKNEELFRDSKSIRECFKTFDRNNDDLLDLAEFEQLLKALFSCNGTPYFISLDKVQTIFDAYKTPKNEKLTFNDFEKFWNKFIKQTLFPRTALIIVDVQNDFINGTMALKDCPAKQEGRDVVPIINHLIDTIPFDAIVYTLDWHPEDHCSFIENVHKRQLNKDSPTKENIKKHDTVIFEDYPDVEQKLWPFHCVQNTEGAKLHPDLKIIDEKTDPMKRHVLFTKKGSKPDIDSYSAFFDNCKLNETSLNSDLKKHGITDIYVCGLAADVCVAATSFDGLSLNFRVIMIEDASRGIDFDDIEAQKKRLINHGAIVVDSNKVFNMVKCKDRRPELGYSILHLSS